MNYKEKVLNYIYQLKKPHFIEKILYSGYTTLYSIRNLVLHGDRHLFRNVAIEISTTCNRKCIYCPNSKYNLPPKKMPIKLYHLIINQLKVIKFSGSLYFHFYNEPLLDSRLASLVKIAKKALPNCFIRIFTNGDFLNQTNISKLIHSGVFEFVVTQHQPSSTEWQKNLKTLTKKFPKTISLQSLTHTPLSNRGGLIQVTNKENRKNCIDPLQTLQIDIDGNIILCCNDYFRSQKFGNLKEKSIIDIWNDVNYKTIRYELRKGVTNLPICKKCLYANN